MTADPSSRPGEPAPAPRTVADDYAEVLCGPHTRQREQYLADISAYGEPQDDRISMGMVVKRLVKRIDELSRAAAPVPPPPVLRCMRTKERDARVWQCDSFAGHDGDCSFRIDLTYLSGIQPAAPVPPSPEAGARACIVCGSTHCFELWEDREGWKRTASDRGFENIALRQRIAELESERSALAAEVARLREAIGKACAIIETGDQRLLAADGPVGNLPPDLSLAEWRELFITLDAARSAEPEGD